MKYSGAAYCENVHVRRSGRVGRHCSGRVPVSVKITVVNILLFTIHLCYNKLAHLKVKPTPLKAFDSSSDALERKGSS
jgi:hypothetical protein